MSAVLVTWVFYSSTFFRVGYASIDVEQFATMEQCVLAKEIVTQTISQKTDELVVVCRPL